ncbi:MAG: hypothetical protein AAGH88_07615 [Planctomycetota bacterium]
MPLPLVEIRQKAGGQAKLEAGDWYLAVRFASPSYVDDPDRPVAVRLHTKHDDSPTDLSHKIMNWHDSAGADNPDPSGKLEVRAAE